MRVKRGPVVRLLEVLGAKTAAGWSDEKLLEKLQSLSEMVGEEADLETDAQVKLCSDLLDAVSAGEEIEIVEGGSSSASAPKKKAAKKKVAKEEPEEEEEEEDDDLEEEEELEDAEDEEEEEPEEEEEEPEPAPKKKAAKKKTAKKPQVTSEPGGSGKKVAKKKPVKKVPVEEEKEDAVKAPKKKVAKKKVAKAATVAPKKKVAKKKTAGDKPAKKASAGRDQLGGRLGTGVADINKVLLAMKKSLTTTEIADKCGQSSTRVSSHLCTLQSRGMVEKDDDGRFTVVAYAEEE